MERKSAEYKSHLQLKPRGTGHLHQPDLPTGFGSPEVFMKSVEIAPGFTLPTGSRRPGTPPTQPRTRWKK